MDVDGIEPDAGRVREGGPADVLFRAEGLSLSEEGTPATVDAVEYFGHDQLVTIHLANFWAVKLPPADAIYVFLIDRLMPKLDAKLASELKRSTPVISYVFNIPGRTPEATLRNAARYRYGA